MSSSEAALPSTRWRTDWWRLLEERDRISCQQSGPRGPPFVPGLKAARTLSRWLPWNWYSIDGTGWCYDMSWDEMRPCAEIEGSVDWNGVGNLPGAGNGAKLPLPPYQLLVICCISCIMAGHMAYGLWAARRARRSADDAEAPATHTDSGSEAAGANGIRAWLRSGRAVPWHWDHHALHALLGAALGLLVALTLPLPQVSSPTWLGTLGENML